MDELDCAFTIATPAFPDNARTVFKGHLFVGDVLLSDSGMRDHPLTPMTDANLVRVLQAQLAPAPGGGRAGRRVGLVDHRATGASATAIGARFDALRKEGVAIAIADAIDNDDLQRLGEAVRDLPLVCAGSGLAIGLPRNFAIAASGEAAALPAVNGFSAIVSGSCSQATNAQVAEFLRGRRRGPSHRSARARRRARDVALPATSRPGPNASGRRRRDDRCSSTAPRRRKRSRPRKPAPVRTTSARDSSALLAGIAKALVERGARRLVVAGGETSGACVQALGVERLRIGRQIDPGVPWCHAAPALAPDGLQLALKSGNFGGVDFFTRAFEAKT